MKDSLPQNWSRENAPSSVQKTRYFSPSFFEPFFADKFVENFCKYSKLMAQNKSYFTFSISVDEIKTFF